MATARKPKGADEVFSWMGKQRWKGVKKAERSKAMTRAIKKRWQRKKTKEKS